MKHEVVMGLFCLFGLSCSSARQYPISEHFDGKKFYNPGHNNEKSFWSFLKWQFTADRKEWPTWVEAKATYQPRKPQAGELLLTFVNHSTTLVQTQELTLLTDPIWSERASPVSFAGPKRVRAPGVRFEDLPTIDLVLISHNHYDHLDIETLRRLDQKFSPVFLVPLGDEVLLKKNGIENVVAMDWWQVENIKGVEVTFLPKLHWSGRGLFDRFESLWGAFGLRLRNHHFYFGGDTGYSEHLKMTRARWGAPDISLIPIGAYEPRWFMKENHMNPAEAVQAFQDLETQFAMGIHYGTFQLTDEGWDEPVKHLTVARDKAGLSAEKFFTLEEGETRSFPAMRGTP